MINVGIVVITFNRLNYLKDLIESIRKQTYRGNAIYVVNNSSTDGTNEWLNTQTDITIINQDNIGSSGGQYTGIKAAYQNGHDFIWTMDDDVLPALDCLENLIKYSDDYSIITPLRITNQGYPFLNDAIKYNFTNPFKSIWTEILSEEQITKEIINAEGITFEGPLINREVIQKIGFPERNFFIYGDDTEYFIRASRNGFVPVIATSAKLYRRLPAPANHKEFTWKTYYSIRNIIAIDRLHGNFMIRNIRPVGYFIAWLINCRKYEHFKTVFKAFKDGLRYKSSK